MCSSIPGNGRRGRCCRCTPRCRPWATIPAPCNNPFTQTVADFHLMFGLQLLVKVPHVQIEILLPIQPQNFLHHRHRHFLARRFSPPPVKQSPESELFIALPPAPHLPVADPATLPFLPPRD